MAFPKGDKRTGERAKKPMKGIKLDKSLLIDTLTKQNGNVSRTADVLGCSRYTISDWLNRDEDVKKACQDARERMLDELEESCFERAIEGNGLLTMFLLKTQGKSRGYEQDESKSVSDIAKEAFQYVINKSKNPAESN